MESCRVLKKKSRERKEGRQPWVAKLREKKEGGKEGEREEALRL